MDANIGDPPLSDQELVVNMDSEMPDAEGALPTRDLSTPPTTAVAMDDEAVDPPLPTDQQPFTNLDNGMPDAEGALLPRARSTPSTAVPIMEDELDDPPMDDQYPLINMQDEMADQRERAANAARVALALSIPRPPTPIFILPRDPSIQCTCSILVQRLAKDLDMVVTKDKGITWLHRPCQPHSAKAKVMSENEGTAPAPVDDDVNMEDAPQEGAATSNSDNRPAPALSSFLGANPSPDMRTKVKNFTGKFICDGPCEHVSKTLQDYSMCKKCLAWQHNECMLYGEEGDHGGPVCNHCYMNFLAHHEEIDRWQRRRLMEAVQETFMFLVDPETEHEVWRREWCKKFMQRFFHTVSESHNPLLKL